jgi:hypothetical protein
MKALYRTKYRAPFVCMTYQEGTIERFLNRLKAFPFQCQLRFRAFWEGLAQREVRSGS